MKAKFCVSCIFLSLLIGGVYASEQAPILVSPGSDVGIAMVGEVCPTFSWTAVAEAVAYRVEIFNAIDNIQLTYEEMTTSSYPVLTKEIQGAASSWTPSSDQRLFDDGIYVWYVQALDAYGNGAWSNGKIFRIKVGAGFSAIEDTLGETLEEHGISEDVITDVIEDLRAEVAKGEGGQTETLDLLTPIRVQGNETGTNTYYGENAGFSLTALGVQNSFFGNSAGYSVTEGDYNAFVGYHSGYSSTGSYNAFLGYQAGYNTTGGLNTFVGYLSGYTNTAGQYNTFLGSRAGYFNTTGEHNTFVGNRSGNNSTASNNTFIGSSAGETTSTGADNVFVGHFAGIQNGSGSANTFVGKSTGHYNTTGANNTFLGYNAGYGHYMGLTGNYNTFIGSNAGHNNGTGTNNTFVGNDAGNTNTSAPSNTFIGASAGYANTSGNQNTFLGHDAGYTNTQGLQNTFLGYQAGYSNIDGNHNTYVGNQAGYTNINHDGNTCIGWGAGYSNVGYRNVFIGYRAGYNETGLANTLFIDNSDTSEPLIWGNFNTDFVAFHGKVGINTKSSTYPMEMKQTGTNASFVVNRTDGAMNFINATDYFGNFGTVNDYPLRLVQNGGWKMRLDTDKSLTMRNGATCTAGGVWTNASSRELKENIHDITLDQAVDALNELRPVTYNYKADKDDEHVGFVAEDVPDLVASKDRKGMSPMDVVAVLTKVLQEQQKTIEELKAEVEKLKKEIESW